MDKNKKILLLVIAILILAVIGGWLYFFLSSRKASAPKQGSLPSSSVSPTASPIISPSTGLFSLITTDWLLAPKAVENQQVIAFAKVPGLFKTYSTLLGSTQSQNLSETKFDNLENVIWSPDNRYALLQYRDRANAPQFTVFDIQQNLTYQLPGFIQALAWSSQSNQLLGYKNLAYADEAYFFTVSPDGSGEKKILNFKISNPALNWPNANYFTFYAKTAALSSLDKVFIYDLKNKVLTDLPLALVRQGGAGAISGLQTTSSPDGHQLLLSFTNIYGAALTTLIYDTQAPYNVEREEFPQSIVLPFSTLADKCAWSKDNETVYCAYADAFKNPGNFTLPFDYWAGRFSSNDSFASYNLKTGELKIYAENTAYDAASLSLAPDESYLTFINRKDENLYKLKLQ